MKQEWLEGAKFSVKYEAINRERMNAAGRLSEYNYLTGENKIIQRHKEAIEIYKNNNNSIPDELLANILILQLPLKFFKFLFKDFKTSMYVFNSILSAFFVKCIISSCKGLFVNGAAYRKLLFKQPAKFFKT